MIAEAWDNREISLIPQEVCYEENTSLTSMTEIIIIKYLSYMKSIWRIVVASES